MATSPTHANSVKRAFVAYIDTYFGFNMAAKLSALDYEVHGLLKEGPSPFALHPKVKRVYRRVDHDQIKKALLDCDHIVYQLGLTTEDSVQALRFLSSAHYEGEKRFVLVSSLMTWFETPLAVDNDEEAPEPLSEDQYNRRVPHIKYAAWRDAEKLAVACNSERLRSFAMFSGLLYGNGEDVLHPLMKQAWNLGPEGLPIFGTGKQVVPMIHIGDLCSFVHKTFTTTQEDLPEGRYFFATDEGNCTWQSVIDSINTSLGTGKSYRVPSHDLPLYDNVEQFVVNLRVDAAQIGRVMDDADWTCRSGFAENIDLVVKQYRAERRIEPHRIVIIGPPAAGKSFAAREISSALKVPCFSIGDIIAEYRYQEIELKEELQRLRTTSYEKRRAERIDEKRAAILEERKAAHEAALAEKEGAALEPEADDDDVEEEEEIDVVLTAEDEAELRDGAMDEEAEEAFNAVNERLEEIKRVLAMKLKPVGIETQEPPNPKDKKKNPPKPTKKEVVEVKEEPGKEMRLSDRALAIMVRWKLTRAPSRNQGFILDGFPKTIRQARLVFEDVPLEVPEDPDEPDLELDKDEKPAQDTSFPELVLHLRASDTFLLERIQKTMGEHPHNLPAEFQRRLEHYKNNFEIPFGVAQWFESAKTQSGRSAVLKSIDMESTPLVPPPPPKSQYAAKPVDPTIAKMIEFIGKPHNFGPTLLDMQLEAERLRLYQAEQQAIQDAQLRERQARESEDVAQLQNAKQEESARLMQMKEREREMLEQRKGPLKQYLMANVIPVLTKGLIEVCTRRPADPVDFLAEWLFKHNPEDHPEMYL